MVVQPVLVNPALRSTHDTTTLRLFLVFVRCRGGLFPDLVSVFIAVDPCTRANGCLQVIPGSHRLGRIDHVLTGEQAVEPGLGIHDSERIRSDPI